MVQKKRGLGRGLDALFQDSEHTRRAVEEVERPQKPEKKDRLPISNLTPGQYQPRRHFDNDAIDQLAESIAQHGVLQPLLVRPLAGKDQYEIIAGERRWRAAQRAQLHEIPVIIQDLGDEVALEIALIENLQREDLSAIEEAEGFQRLIEEFSYTQDVLSKKLGKSRSHVANTLRLLKLPEKIKTYVQDGQLSAGHARAVLGAKDPVALARKVVEEGLSVRATEKLALTHGVQPKPQQTQASPHSLNSGKDADTVALERELSSHLGMRVTVDTSAGGSGRLSIHYKTLDQFDAIMEKLAR